MPPPPPPSNNNEDRQALLAGVWIGTIFIIGIWITLLVLTCVYVFINSSLGKKMVDEQRARSMRTGIVNQ